MACDKFDCYIQFHHKQLYKLISSVKSIIKMHSSGNIFITVKKILIYKLGFNYVHTKIIIYGILHIIFPKLI